VKCSSDDLVFDLCVKIICINIKNFNRRLLFIKKLLYKKKERTRVKNGFQLFTRNKIHPVFSMWNKVYYCMVSHMGFQLSTRSEGHILCFQCEMRLLLYGSTWVFNFPHEVKSTLHRLVLSVWNEVNYCVVPHEFLTFRAKWGLSFAQYLLNEVIASIIHRSMILITYVKIKIIAKWC